jgi:hypothetical protein
MKDTEQPLPELQDAMLDPGTLDQLITDLTTMTSDLSVRLKTHPEILTGAEPASLEEGLQALRNGDVLGIQVRYRYGADRWCDTLLRTGDGIRLVRIRLSDGQ